MAIHAFLHLLKECGKRKDLETGLNIHNEMVRTGVIERDIWIRNTLVDMYVKCGSLTRAYQVFEELPIRNVVMWTCLLSGFSDNGRANDAIDLFDRMQIEGVYPNAVTFVCILKACGSIRAFSKGNYIHGEIERLGLLTRSNPSLGGALVDMYMKCGVLIMAHEVLEHLPVRNVVSWTALLAGYVEHDLGKKALECFREMQKEGISPNVATIVCALRACHSILAIDEGQRIHAYVRKNNSLEGDIIVGSALVDMYAKFGLLSEAQEVFDKLLGRDVASWTSLLAGYAEHGYAKDALKCFQQMQMEGVPPNSLTLVCILKACASTGVAGNKGIEIHSEIERRELLERNVFVGSSLVDMYAKCGLAGKAQEVFDKLSFRNVVSWNALISGYIESGDNERALKCFEEMQLEGLLPDMVTLIFTMKVCGNVGAVSKGTEIHAAITRKGLLEGDFSIGCSLVDMYAKFGWLTIAKQVFDKLPLHNVVSWNSLIMGYAQFGESITALEGFEQMLKEGVKPDEVTFIIILNACSRARLFAESHAYFESMSKDYGIVPAAEHHSCIVDNLSRMGQIHEAIWMIKKLPFSIYGATWNTVLDACKTVGNVGLGNYAFHHLVCPTQSSC